MLIRPKPEKAPGERCAACEEESAGCTWDTPLCEAHWGIAATEMPTASDIQARAKPDEALDVIACEYVEPIVVLKDGVLERYYRAWVKAWVAKQKQKQSTVRLVAP